MTTEANFRRSLREAFTARYPRPIGWFTAFVPGRGQKPGLPDTLFCTSDASTWVEVKVDDGVLSSSQRLVCGQLARSGQRVFVVRRRRTSNIEVRHVTRAGEESYSMTFSSLAEDQLWARLFTMPFPATATP